MKARYHVAASSIVSAGTYVLSDSATMAAVTLFSGIFMDADHLIDYIFMHRPPYNIGHFFETYSKNKQTHVLLMLHSWELIVILAIIAMASNWEPFSTGLLIGMGHHMVLDQIFNHAYPLSYFLTFRIFSRLSSDRCFYGPTAKPNNKNNSD